MQFHVLAVDYDGTLAHGGVVDGATLAALDRFRDSGRRLILVTGRRLEPLQELFPRLSIFERVVAENGALIFDPATEEERLLCEATPPEFLERLMAEGVTRVESGRVIVATWQPHETAALKVIRELNLELQIIFNKDAVMILPTGVNKAAGLQSVLDEIGLSLLNTVAVGDAENDIAMLSKSGASAAVGNALDSVKQRSDIVLQQKRGAGVQELIEHILEDDLHALAAHPRRRIVLGQRLDGEPFSIPLSGESVLVTGGPGGGKSKFAVSFLEQLTQMGAQCVILDPEGDYQGLQDSIVLGTADRAPKIEEIIGVLRQPIDHCVVSFFSIPKEVRPAHFDRLHRALAEQRSRTGRPHWIVVDEAHYAAPRKWEPADAWSHGELKGVMFLTAYQDRISLAVMKSVDWIISIADDPRDALQDCAALLQVAAPQVADPPDDQTHHALAWHRADHQAMWFRRLTAKEHCQRHRHSYYDGEMDDNLRFVFRGPNNQLELPAQNLKIFMQMAAGVDEQTWNYHLYRNDIANWFEHVIRDSELTNVVRSAQGDPALDAHQTRQLIFEKIKDRFEPKS